MVDTVMQILSWAIPSGGIGAAIAWVANRKVKQAESAKQIHDTYKVMYEDISQELVTIQKKSDENTKAMEALKDENSRTRRALNRLSRAIEAIQSCPHRGSCPVSGELSLDEEGDGDRTDAADSPGKRKPRQQRKPKPDGGEPEGGDGDGRAVDGADVQHHTPARRKPADSDPEPPEAADSQLRADQDDPAADGGRHGQPKARTRGREKE